MRFVILGILLITQAVEAKPTAKELLDKDGQEVKF
jgi:hypothetical protein